MASAVSHDENETMASALLQRQPSSMTLKVENLAHVREKVQKKTFTRWANMSLPADDKIQDLFVDFQTGHKLLKLIAALSDHPIRSLTPERGKMEIHHRANVQRALDALSEVNPRHGISISAIYEGIPKLTLALVWHLVLSYSHLQHNIEMGVTAETHCKEWCSRMTDGYVGLENVDKDFLGTWATGLVVPALINRNKPELIDYSDLYYNKTPDERFHIAFEVAETSLNVPQLLDVEDMNRSRVDDQSVITYVLHLNKTLTDTVPNLPPAILQLKHQVTKVVEENIPEETPEELDVTPVQMVDMDPFTAGQPPQIIAETREIVSASPEQSLKSPTDEDSGLELDDSPVNGHHNKPMLRDVQTNGIDKIDTKSQRGSTITLDSEADYISATSSPIVSRKDYSEESVSDDTMDNNSDESLTPPGPNLKLPLSTSPKDPRHYHEQLQQITNLPNQTSTTKSGLEELIRVLQDKRVQCQELQRDIHSQLNSKQERDKRAELHQLLTQTGGFDDALNSATSEVSVFIEALEEFNEAVANCEEFVDHVADLIAEKEIPSTSDQTQQQLNEQRNFRSGLEEEQRKLEYALRALSRSIPRVIPLSVTEQQRTATVIQNRLSDMELVLNGSIETLTFLCSRIPSMEQKLLDADNIITKVEDGIDSFETGGNPENLQFQIERAQTHLGTVGNLFLAIESFNNEFNPAQLQDDWSDLSKRCIKSEKEIRELLEAEEELSEEVIAISDWAETLEKFLQRKIKPISSRKELREVQSKWRQVSNDLKSKCDEIDTLSKSDYSPPDHRVMSPLDKDTLLALKCQLTELQGPLQKRREMLQDAYSSWGNVESQMKSISQNMLELEFRTTKYCPESTWAVRPALDYISYLSEYESELSELSEQLQTLVQEIANLSPLFIDTNPIIREKEGLLNKHCILCKRASNKRVKSQRTVLKLEPVLPFLRDEYLKKINWLYGQSLPDFDTKPDQSTNKMLAAINNNSKQKSTVAYSEYWHILKAIAPEKIPFMALTLFAYALGPWGMGCATDRPLNIFDFTPEILI